MRAKLAFWWVFLSYVLPTFGDSVDWGLLKSDLGGDQKILAATKVAKNWESRPADFFEGISEEAWRRVIPLLSSQDMAEIQGKDFEGNQPACKAFARYLPKLSHKESLPQLFRLSVYELLAQSDKAIAGQSIRESLSEFVGYYFSQAVESLSLAESIIKSIPVSWVEQEGRLIMSMLVKSGLQRLGFFSEDSLIALLGNNSDNGCELITLHLLLGLKQKDLALISPNCINVIRGIENMDLSGIVKSLRKDAFAKYNGPLNKQTIQQLSAEQVEYYGSLIENEKICTLLELHHLSRTAAVGITVGCLCGYLNSHRHSVGLRELWNVIPLDRIQGLTQIIRPSLIRIPLKDYDSMVPELLKLFISHFGVCPTVEISFWTDKKIRYISAECLYRILTETKPPVVLGELWNTVPWQELEFFSIIKKSSWRNIDHKDFYLMKIGTLSIISSGPGVCSKLQTSFWLGDKIKGISGQCLYELLTKREGGIPLKLGNLWRHIFAGAIYDFVTKLKFFWDIIHPDDRNFVQKAIGLAINSCPEICSALDISFWTKETIKYFKPACMEQATKSLTRPITLGELWRSIPRQLVEYFKTGDANLLCKFSGKDFQHMSSELLSGIISLDNVEKVLPKLSGDIFLSSKASEVIVDALRFRALVRSVPKFAGQLLWYSGKLPENILSSCNGDDIRSLRLAILGEAELDWKELFSKLEEKYSSGGRGEVFIRMIHLISDKADSHFCATIKNLEEFLSLPWLALNFDYKCWSELPFDLNNPPPPPRKTKRRTLTAQQDIK